MKSINIAELKAQLSACLRLAQAGERIVVLDRRLPIAQIAPLDREQGSWESLSETGQVHLGTQAWSGLRLSRLRRRVPVQQLLAAVREDT